MDQLSEIRKEHAERFARHKEDTFITQDSARSSKKKKLRLMNLNEEADYEFSDNIDEKYNKNQISLNEDFMKSLTHEKLNGKSEETYIEKICSLDDEYAKNVEDSKGQTNFMRGKELKLQEYKAEELVFDSFDRMSNNAEKNEQQKYFLNLESLEVLKNKDLCKRKQIIFKEKNVENEKTSITEYANNNVDEHGNIFDILCWNIDGLDDRYLRLRTMGVVELVEAKQPAAVFLQEVVDSSLDYIKKRLCSQYYFVTPNNRESNSFAVPYFCVILVSLKKFTIKKGSENTVWFSESMMGRHLLSVEVFPTSNAKNTILLMTSHLESTKEFREERINQFKKCIKMIRNSGSQLNEDVSLCVFGGDLNIRDNEVKASALPLDIIDAWQYLGKPKNSQYTWDTLLNDNKEFGSKKFKVRYRFDRIFFYQRKSQKYLWKPTNLDLVGKTKLKSCDMFPSDHFGLHLCFKLEK